MSLFVLKGLTEHSEWVCVPVVYSQLEIALTRIFVLKVFGFFNPNVPSSEAPLVLPWASIITSCLAGPAYVGFNVEARLMSEWVEPDYIPLEVKQYGNIFLQLVAQQVLLSMLRLSFAPITTSARNKFSMLEKAWRW